MTTALITGASAGIGRAFAREIAGRGTDLVIVARDAARLNDLARDLRSVHDIDVEVLAADLTDQGDLDRVAARLGDPQRPIDLLVNNAGLGQKRSFLNNSLENELAAFDLMCRAVLVLSHAAGRAMRERHRGAIINVSSMASFLATGSYSAEKSFVTVFTESLASELHGSGVTATAVCPGFTHTEFHARARQDLSSLPDFAWLDADQVARVALDDAAAGKVISVPGAAYKAARVALRFAPRTLLRTGLMKPGSWKPGLR